MNNCCFLLFLCIGTIWLYRRKREVFYAILLAIIATAGLVYLSYVICVDVLDIEPKQEQDFNTYFPLAIAILTSIFATTLTFVSAQSNGKDKQQQAALQETTLHNDLEDIKQQLKDIKETSPPNRTPPLPTTPSSPASSAASAGKNDNLHQRQRGRWWRGGLRGGMICGCGR